MTNVERWLKIIKLANNVLIEAEAIKECENSTGKIALAEELTKDAIELAKLTVDSLEKVA